MRRMKVAAITVGGVLAALLAVTMWATELTRAVARQVAESPITLPQEVDIRYSNRLAAILGKGTTNGTAAAITLGYVIVVPTWFDNLPLAQRSRIIRHELVHVEQRRSRGRLYLPVYCMFYLMHGYEDHPFEREARTAEAL